MIGQDDPGVHIYNLGTDEYCEVRDSASWIAARMGLQPEFTFTGGKRGWVGDSPFIYLDTAKIRSIGWKPRLTIRQAVERTVDYLTENYGLQVNTEDFYVTYDAFASNLMPTITVRERGVKDL